MSPSPIDVAQEGTPEGSHEATSEAPVTIAITTIQQEVTDALSDNLKSPQNPTRIIPNFPLTEPSIA